MLLVSLREEDIIRTSLNSNANNDSPAGDNCVDNIFKPSSIS